VKFDGDPRLFETGNGADLHISAGQPEMDAGLENAVYISLFSSKDWWGNLVSTGSEKLESNLETLSSAKLTNATRQSAEEFAREALAWLLADGVASKITPVATIPAVGFLGLEIKIEQPGRTSVVRYSINWAEFAVRMGAS
jgi:phage gp46-like protein